MSPVIGIIDYGLGNISAFVNIYRDLGLSTRIVSDNSSFNKVTHLILPGVGSFDWAISCLDNTRILDNLNHYVLDIGVPILGVCVGLQIMCTKSSEGSSSGLSWFNADVRSLCAISPESSAKLVLPHMGWNTVTTFQPIHPLFVGITDLNFYFLHSYYTNPFDSSLSIAHTSYGFDFCCAAPVDNFFGVQFHPEKSHESGVRLLKNFAHLNPC